MFPKYLCYVSEYIYILTCVYKYREKYLKGYSTGMLRGHWHQKSKTVQQQMYTKLEELHNAYKKARSSLACQWCCPPLTTVHRILWQPYLVTPYPLLAVTSPKRWPSKHEANTHCRPECLLPPSNESLVTYIQPVVATTPAIHPALVTPPSDNLYSDTLYSDTPSRQSYGEDSLVTPQWWYL